MKYYKIIDGITQYSDCRYIELNGCGVSNPTEAMIYAAGWRDYIAPEIVISPEEKLAASRISKIQESNDYADSPAVKSVLFNGEERWATPAERDNYLSTLMGAKRLGIYSVPFFGIELDTDAAINIIDTINVWAMRVTAIKDAHEKAIMQINSQEALDAYDYTIGYPDKLIFNTTT